MIQNVKITNEENAQNSKIARLPNEWEVQFEQCLDGLHLDDVHFDSPDSSLENFKVMQTTTLTNSETLGGTVVAHPNCIFCVPTILSAFNFRFAEIIIIT